MQSEDSNDGAINLFKEDEKQQTKKFRKKQSKLEEMEFNDDEEEEEQFEDSDDVSDRDDDDDQDEDEESRGPDRKKKKKKLSTKKNKKRKAKRGVEAFFDDEAYESSVDEEEEDDDFADAELRNIDAKKKTEEYYKKSRKNESLLELLKGKDEDEVNEIMQRRSYNQYMGDLNSPSVKDPKVYQVPVLKGKEDALTLAILNKASQLYNKKEEALAICSVMSMKRKFPGYIFVEAMSQQAVKKSLQGFHDVMPRDMLQVKDDQYQNLFKEKDTVSTNIKELDYVRIKGGRYDGDLGKIYKLRKNGFEIILQPRIDRTKLLNEIRYVTDSEVADKEKAYVRIIKKHFSTKDIVVHKSRPDKAFITNDQLPNIQIARRPKLSHEGMIILPFGFDQVTKSIGTITVKEAELFKKDDSLTEFTRKELKYLASTINIVKGDDVEVVFGDMKGVVGVVKQVNDNIAVIEAKNNPRLGVFEEQIDKLAKKFRLKQIVSVITGNYKDRVGRILQIDHQQATILTENNNEIVVHTNNLKLSDGIPQSLDSSATEYHKNDLVLTLGVGDGVGMVLSASRDSLTVLDMNNSIKVVSVMDVDKKLDTKINKAINIYKEQIRQGAIVRIIEGKYGGKKVQVRHIYKNNLFVTSNEIGLHGAHVIRDTNCTLVTQSAVKPKSFFNKAPQNNSAQKPGSSSYNNEKEDELPKGKIVTIKSGQYKGYQGQIVSCIGERVEVKLTAKLGKKVTVKKEDIVSQAKNLDIGKTPRITTGSLYASQSPAPGYENRRAYDY